MKRILIPMMALAVAAPAMAQSRGDVRDSRDRLQQERAELREAQRYGNRRDVKDERKDVKRAEKQLRKDAKDWQRGRNYNWNQPDPRYGGYYADNYYRSGPNYRPVPLRANDRIYRGQDNRYYCRRSDGTTGLIIGAIGGGVLGNVIAPGGSKTLGSIIGGGLGAVLGQSVDRNQIVCR